ncbi:hypothetical protein RHMOL_Rhmol09G0100700 [Rhododendron molle]|uniref:Uncharacterized protein n=1 Tax=Rhododendron molle TaxID=49168 RepID=A0ACC0MBY6_RHOML|nr:hypothetical protein RHMOL_Rhmol09G0100700 [Rhododendron molle]
MAIWSNPRVATLRVALLGVGATTAKTQTRERERERERRTRKRENEERKPDNKRERNLLHPPSISISLSLVPYEN